MMKPEKIVLASGNQKKIKELQNLLTPLNIEVVTQGEFDICDAEETGLSFVENAILKARHASKQSGLPAIADDSGIEVDALNGKPGIYSARFAGDHGNDAKNNAQLLQEMEHVPDQERTARFQCVLVYMSHAEDPTPIICQGTWEGKILTDLSGEGGFGYDPLFYVPDQQCSAAELSAERKAALSHRGKAMEHLQHRLEEQFNNN